MSPQSTIDFIDEKIPHPANAVDTTQKFKETSEIYESRTTHQ